MPSSSGTINGVVRKRKVCLLAKSHTLLMMTSMLNIFCSSSFLLRFMFRHLGYPLMELKGCPNLCSGIPFSLSPTFPSPSLVESSFPPTAVFDSVGKERALVKKKNRQRSRERRKELRSIGLLRCWNVDNATKRNWQKRISRIEIVIGTAWFVLYLAACAWRETPCLQYIFFSVFIFHIQLWFCQVSESYSV